MGTELKDVPLSQDVCIDGCIWFLYSFVVTGCLFKRLPGAPALHGRTGSDSDTFRCKAHGRWQRCMCAVCSIYQKYSFERVPTPVHTKYECCGWKPTINHYFFWQKPEKHTLFASYFLAVVKTLCDMWCSTQIGLSLNSTYCVTATGNQTSNWSWFEPPHPQTTCPPWFARWAGNAKPDLVACPFHFQLHCPADDQQMMHIYRCRTSMSLFTSWNLFDHRGNQPFHTPSSTSWSRKQHHSHVFMRKYCDLLCANWMDNVKACC